MLGYSSRRSGIAVEFDRTSSAAVREIAHCGFASARQGPRTPTTQSGLQINFVPTRVLARTCQTWTTRLYLTGNETDKREFAFLACKMLRVNPFGESKHQIA